MVSFVYRIGIGLTLLLLSACGNKPDGTPYGVNPAKLPDGQLKPTTDSTRVTTPFKGNKIPKAAELNAISNGMRAGQPSGTPPPQ